MPNKYDEDYVENLPLGKLYKSLIYARLNFKIMSLSCYDNIIMAKY